MTITAMFDRVKWIKGALSANDGENSRISGTTTPTFLSMDNLNEQSCGAVCAVGSIMFDIGATMDNFTSGVPRYNSSGILTTRPKGGWSQFDVFVVLLRRYTIEMTQHYFVNGLDGVSYLDATNWYSTVQSRQHDKGRNYYKDDINRIESFNDSPFSTEEDVRNFLDVLETLPDYRMLHGLLTSDDPSVLEEIFAQALRLDPDIASETECDYLTDGNAKQFKLLQPIPYEVFNTIFGLDIPHNED